MKFYGSQKFENWSRVSTTGEAIGEDRPIGRVTVARNRIKAVSAREPGPWRYLLFNQGSLRNEVELPGIKSIEISRGLSQDAATCTIVLYNTNEGGTKPTHYDDVGQPGFLTFNRGDIPISTIPTSLDNYIKPDVLRLPNRRLGDWGFSPNQYRDLLIPNRLLRTYQGYGSDNLDDTGNIRPPGDQEYVAPRLDSKLGLTGTWLIDRVSISASAGTITLECRDLAKILMEQIIYPPMIPLNRFPLKYGPIVVEEFPPEVSKEEQTVSGGNTITGLGAPPGYYHNSNQPWGFTTVYGHHPNHAFDGKTNTYWLSVGNGQPSAGYSFEYVTGKANGDEINEVLVRTAKSGYTCYVSIYEGGSWQGSNTIPYDPNHPSSFPNGSNIPFVTSVSIAADKEQVIKLPRKYKAQFVRVTFTKLQDFGLGTFKFRAAVRTLRTRLQHTKTLTNTTPGWTETNEGEPGVITDWSTAVLELLGWAGFSWLETANPELYPNPVISSQICGPARNGMNLNFWAEVQRFGAGPVEETPSDVFMNKSFMQGVNYIKDLLGAIFFIDEHGAAVFRMPNVFRLGNWAYNPTLLADVNFTYDPTRSLLAYRNELPIELHDNVNLMEYNVVLDDSSLRSQVIVVAESPDVHSHELISGAVDLTADSSAASLRNIMAGQQRLFMVPGENSKGFKTARECQIMAELTAMFILFTYRKASVTAMAHPGLQPDDQIRIYERQSNEYFVHYVSSVNTSMDLESGSYTMQLTTHWLGEAPVANDASQWMPDFAPLDKSKELQAIYEQLESRS